MNKLIGMFLLGSALSLTACGGDSDSSGSSNNNSTPIQFQGLPNCAISDANITVEQYSRGCLVKGSKLISGRTFSLKCETRLQETLFPIVALSDRDAKAVKDDIENFNGKYTYICKGLSRS